MKLSPELARKLDGGTSGLRHEVSSLRSMATKMFLYMVTSHLIFGDRSGFSTRTIHNPHADSAKL